MNPNENIDDGDDFPVYIDDDDTAEVIDIDPRNEDDELGDMADMDLAGADDDDMYEGGSDNIVPERDDAVVTFTKHTDSVLCVSIDPAAGQLAATGGQDDAAFVWKICSGEVLLECTGHKDSVNCVGFSSDSRLIATGDMSGLIKVWNTETAKEIWSFEVSDLEWIRWHKAAHVLLAGTADGSTWMWKIPSQEFKTFPGPGVKCTVGEFLPDGKRACVGYEDGTVKVFDLKSGSALMTSTSTTQGHQETVTCLACHQDNRLVLTGSTDMLVLLTNTENGKVLARFDCKNLSEGSDGSEDDSVESVEFSPVSFNYAAVGTLSGLLIIWDMSSQSVRHKLQHKDGIVKLCWNSTEPHIYTCSLDGSVYVWDARHGSLLSNLQGHTAHILDMDLSRDNSSIVSVSDDRTAKVFQTKTSAAQPSSASS